MDLAKLFQMQNALDSHIEEKHGLQEEDLFSRKILALLVELSELANETRCFKFWSIKPSSPSDVILEEFVDGVHFILSLGLECGFNPHELQLNGEPAGHDITGQFLSVYEAVHRFHKTKSLQDYQRLFTTYLELASLLDITDDEMEQAYFAKNEVNYQRQQNNY